MQTYLSSLVWQLRAVESRVRMSSSLPYGKLRPSDDVTTTSPYWPGFTHSDDVLHIYTISQVLHWNAAVQSQTRIFDQK